MIDLLKQRPAEFLPVLEYLFRCALKDGTFNAVLTLIGK